MALTGLGYRLLSDDRTFCSLGDGGITAYGLPRPLKLRSDAGSFLKNLEIGSQLMFRMAKTSFYAIQIAEMAASLHTVN